MTDAEKIKTLVGKNTLIRAMRDLELIDTECRKKDGADMAEIVERLIDRITEDVEAALADWQEDTAARTYERISRAHDAAVVWKARNERKSAESVIHWVSTAERLPLREFDVWMADHEDVYPMFLAHIKGAETCTELPFDGENFFDDGHVFDYTPYDVDYWAEMPKVPEEKTK